MTMVAAELGVDTLKGRVTRGLGLRDTASKVSPYSSSHCLHVVVPVTVSLLGLVVLGAVL